MRILVLSDLHLEFASLSPVYEGQRIDDGVDVVVLAGDIAEGVQGIRWARETFSTKEVVYVAGNHEFYDNNINSLSLYLREVAQRMGVLYLERDAVNLRGVRFLGTTLWSDFELLGAQRREDSMREAALYMNDFRLIKTLRGIEPNSNLVMGQRLFQPSDALREHGLSRAWLEGELSRSEPARTVVVTHHAPHHMSVHPRYANKALNGAYASDLEALMGRSALWIHGHTHDSFDYRVGGTRVLCNPRGYLRKDGSFENAGFKPACVVDIA